MSEVSIQVVFLFRYTYIINISSITSHRNLLQANIAQYGVFPLAKKKRPEEKIHLAWKMFPKQILFN